jgi:hypothetical protein
VVYLRRFSADLFPRRRRYTRAGPAANSDMFANPSSTAQAMTWFLFHINTQTPPGVAGIYALLASASPAGHC